MQTDDLLIETVTKFSGNTGPYDHQPIYLATNNLSLTGHNFLSMVRVRKNRNETTSGILVMYMSSTAGIQSFSGTHATYARSFTADSNASSADSNEYKLTTVITNSRRLDVIFDDVDIPFGEVSDQTINPFNDDLNYIGTGFRPVEEETPPDGSTGQSQVLLYTYNRQEHSQSLTGVLDRTSNGLTASLKGTASGDGLSATVSGWSFGPCEGAVRLDGNGFIESDSSSLFNFDGFSGGTLMCHVKLASTGNTNIMSIGASGTEVMSIKTSDGAFEFKSGASSITAGTLSPGQWYHLAATLRNTDQDSSSGGTFYINGFSASFSGAMADCPVVNPDARLLIGKDMDLVSSGLTGSIGLTRAFNRGLSAEEILLNYLATIPSMTIQNSLKIG
jgi:hypothetical protein